MNEIVTILPSTLVGWIATVLATVASVAFIFSKVRERDMSMLRQSNDDLRAAHDDNTRVINEMNVKITTLERKVVDLEKHNQTLEDLVVTALKQFFSENPKLAKEIKDKIAS